jgi:hypothetical protein
MIITPDRDDDDDQRIDDSADNKEFELTLTDKLGVIAGSDCY